MGRSSLAPTVLYVAGSSACIVFGFACGNTPSPSPSTTQDASSDGNAATDGTGAGDADHLGDGPQDGGAPDALYGACAVHGSFGSPCTAAESGADPTDCTDPGYPECFVGGQGAWCTKTCSAASDCTTGVEDAGCVPTGCNARGYCK